LQHLDALLRHLTLALSRDSQWALAVDQLDDGQNLVRVVVDHGHRNQRQSRLNVHDFVEQRILLYAYDELSLVGLVGLPVVEVYDTSSF